MRFFSLAAATIFLALCFHTPARAAAQKYVEIKIPFANIYEFLDPKSTIIKQVKKGEHLELVYEGTSWYQVKSKEKVGWLDKKAGEVVDSPNYAGGLFTTFFIILLIAGTAYGVSFYIKRQKALVA